MRRSPSARNDSGVSGVLAAVYMGRSEIRDFLIASGAVLELPESRRRGKPRPRQGTHRKESRPAQHVSPDGFPVVALAAFLGHLDVVHIWGTYPTVPRYPRRGHERRSGYNALTGAVTGGHVAVVHWLLEHGADANYRTLETTRRC